MIPLPKISKVYIENSTEVLEHADPEEPDDPVLIPDLWNKDTSLIRALGVVP